jgi:segregation and condensation protein A
MAVHYKLESFEGPLDLLLHLIDKAEVDIYNIPISDITNQYMEYISAMEVLDLDPTSEFLVMAATLLSIKSKMLLPKPPVVDMEVDGYEDGEDPRAELVQKLIEYRKYKGIAEHLRDKELARSLIYTREPEDLTPFIPEVAENPLKGLYMADLMFAFQKVLRRSSRRHTVTKIRRDEISVKDRILEMLTLLQNRDGKILFSKLFSADWTKEELVVTFLALLELMKMKRVTCFQHSLFDEIVIQYRGEGEDNGLSADEIDY